jgi:hypothetical protein
MGIICKICGSKETVRSFASHLRWHHPTFNTKSYIEKYGEFREKIINENNIKNSSNIKCEICGEKLRSHQNLIHHLNKHKDKITWEEYFIKYFFNDIHPKCKCGCGQKVKLIKNGKDEKNQIKYHRDYIKGHWDWIKPGYNSHSDDTKNQMRKYLLIVVL